MNYQQHYDNIINRAKTRTLESYTEKHHIVPRCLGGTNDKDNLVLLTGREHFIAHQLLVKIYPKEYRLAQAAYMMTVSSKSHQNERVGNRLYEWLRIKHAKAMSESQSGEKHSQYNTMWIYNYALHQNKKINKNDPIPNGWIKGRKFKKHSNALGTIKCKQCLSDFVPVIAETLCSDACRSASATFNASGANAKIWKGVIVTPLGTFNIIKEVAKAHNICYTTAAYRIKSNKYADYYRLKP